MFSRMFSQFLTFFCLHKVPDDCPGGPVIHLGGAPWRSFDLELGTSDFHGPKPPSKTAFL